MLLKTIKQHVFAYRTKYPGDEYEATKPEAKVLIALGWCQEATEEMLEEKFSIEVPVRQKRKYRRRDLQAE
jgi:hypothetical protein